MNYKIRDYFDLKQKFLKKFRLIVFCRYYIFLEYTLARLCK